MNFYYSARTPSDASIDFFLEHFKELKEWQSLLSV
jgi:hypothetical protein